MSDVTGMFISGELAYVAPMFGTLSSMGEISGILSSQNEISGILNDNSQSISGTVLSGTLTGN